MCGNTGGGVSPRFELSAQEIVLSAEGATEGIFAHANIPRLGWLQYNTLNALLWPPLNLKHKKNDFNQTLNF